MRLQKRDSDTFWMNMYYILEHVDPAVEKMNRFFNKNLQQGRENHPIANSMAIVQGW